MNNVEVLSSDLVGGADDDFGDGPAARAGDDLLDGLGDVVGVQLFDVGEPGRHAFLNSRLLVADGLSRREAGSTTEKRTLGRAYSCRQAPVAVVTPNLVALHTAPTGMAKRPAVELMSATSATCRGLVAAASMRWRQGGLGDVQQAFDVDVDHLGATRATGPRPSHQ